VQNGDFSAGFTAWTPVKRNKAVVPSTINGYTAPAGAANAAKLGGSTNRGFLAQTLATKTGRCYQLTFYLISQPALGTFFSVSYAGEPLSISAIGNTAITLPSNDALGFGGPVYMQFTTVVTGTSTADALRFNFVKGTGRAFFYLTGISVMPCATGSASPLQYIPGHCLPCKSFP
jgi:hypothetical protein